MRQFGLIGFPLSHSFSKKYFTEKFQKEGISNASYELFPLEAVESLPQLLEQHPEVEGLNVTIPHKQAIIPLLDELDSSAEKVGAVNVIRISNGKKVGFNSDYYGFKASLEKFLTNSVSKALVLGSGGASKAVCSALNDLKIEFQIVSRSAEKGTTYQYLYENPDVLRRHKLIINTTPLGTYPSIESKPDLPYEQLGQDHFLFDLVYNPSETAFMKEGIKVGASVINGYEMLVLQAEKSWEIWNQK